MNKDSTGPNVSLKKSALHTLKGAEPLAPSAEDVTTSPGRPGMSKVWGTAAVALLAGMLVSGGSVWLFETRRMQSNRQAVAELTATVAADINARLTRSLSATYALAAVVQEGKGSISNFQRLAKQMLVLYPGISCLQLAPQGVIADIFPLEGNEKAIGHNLLEDTKRNKEALLARRTHALTLAGPFDLIQGGKAVIGRLPIFLDSPAEGDPFWGFSTAVIRLSDFMDVANVQRITQKDCSYQVFRIHPDFGTREVFASAGNPLHLPVSQSIAVPNGEWTLSVEPSKGWYSWQIITGEGLFVLIFSCLSAFTAWWLALQPFILQNIVEERTHELRETNTRMQSEIAERILAEDILQEKTVELEHEIEERESVQLNLEEKAAALEEEISERSRVEEERAHLEEQLRQSQKMEAIGLLAGGIAHDFNNIISVIMGYGSMLMHMLPQGKAHDNANQILNASERAADLTKGLLAFSRKQTFNLRQTDLIKLTSDNLTFLKRVIGEDVELVTRYHPSPLFLMLDSSQIQQVLMNLSANARDSMPSGGRLSVSITSQYLDDASAFHHGFGSPGDYAVLRVGDTGTGMDKETVQRIFEPFFTTKSQGKGTGLGLSIIHGIVSQHNGFIECESEPGIGTTFSIYLPLCQERPPALDSTLNHHGHSFSGFETILLAEDDWHLMQITTRCLESGGYKVLQAYDGLEAVELFKSRVQDIDLVILDAIMPQMSGKRAWKEIRKLNPKVKTCFFSGYSNDLLNEKLADEARVSMINKPLMPEQLLQKVRELLDHG